MNTSFYLKDARKTSSIYLLYIHQGIRLKFSTSISAQPDHWDKKKKRFKRRKPNALKKNQRLDYLEEAARNVHAELLARNIPITKDTFKKAYEERLEQDRTDYYKILEREKLQFLSPYVEKFIQNRTRSGKYKEGTIQTYRSCQKMIRSYEELRAIQLKFDEIDLNFFYDFLDFMEGTYKRNYISKIVSILKLIMDEAQDDQLHTNNRYHSKRFSVAREEVFNIYLDTEELMKIYELEIFDKPGHDLTRDYFLIEAFTSLRYSDVSRLSKEHIDGDKLKIRQKKGGKYTAVPINPIVRAIITKYNGRFPKAPENQVMNRYLKDIAQWAKIDDPILIGGVKKKKWKLVTTHTGRRSFISNAVKAGIPPLDVMKIAGHSNYKDFLKYYKIEEEQLADALVSHPHFTMMKAVK